MLRQFFDSSALIKYYHNEIGSAKVQILVSGSGSEHYVARLAWVEILSALAKKVSPGTISCPPIIGVFSYACGPTSTAA
jgi:predicted nucleic acid-binding protein